jgi:cytoskeletal protein RodZ
MNWDQFLIRAIVPISFAAIWVLTALFNRESKGFPPRTGAPNSTLGPRPGDPTMRWGSPPSPSPKAPGTRRVPIGDDDILIIQNDPSRSNRPPQTRPLQVTGPRRVARARPAAPPSKVVEPSSPKKKLAGVSQNVNQQLANPVALTPLTTIAPMATATGSDLANAPSSPSKTSAVVTVSTLIPLMNDPYRLREAFIVNDLLQPPLALRANRGRRR